MKKTASLLKRLWNDESGQGTAEYILLLVAIVGVAFLFKKQIMEMVSGRLSEVSGALNGFTVDK